MEARAELEELARILGTRVRPQDLRHPAVAEPFCWICRFTRNGRRVSWSTNGVLFLVDVEASSRIVFAAGQPDLVLGVRNPTGTIDGVSVFRSAVLESVSPNDWLGRVGHQRLLTALALRGRDQLLVAANRTTLIFAPNGVEADLARLDLVHALVEALPPLAPLATRRPQCGVEDEQLPPEVRPLVQLTRRWAISDDVERGLEIEAASDEELNELWRIAGPRLNAIDQFIDSRETGPDESATAFGAVAQAALEARAELARRRAK